MPITILTGLPGSGKSETVITQVNEARRAGRAALTFVCSDSPVMRARPNIVKRGRMGCRAGITTAVDHFVSTERCIELLRAAPPDALLAFDEAQHFGLPVVDAWLAAADRGAEVLIASPNGAQLEALIEQGHETTQIPMDCQVCGERPADTFFCLLHEDRTESVCNPCHDRRKADAERQAIDRLRRGIPFPGEEGLYQPVELSECADWRLLREDSPARFDLIQNICESVGLPDAHSTYLDIGCNTGYFCHRMAQAGFRATGADITVNDIEVARLLGAYVRRDYATYVLDDAYDYLAATRDESFDVTTAFSVIQWVMIQKTPKHGLDCLRWLFEKTRRICILEMGVSKEAHYVKRLRMRYNTPRLRRFMRKHGGFERVEVIDGKSHGIKRDLLVGYKQE